MEEKMNLGSVMESMFKGMENFFGNKTVVGEPIKVDDDTFILPLANVSFGMGAGANVNSEKDKGLGGGGMGAKMSPAAVLVVQNGHARVINIQEQDKLVHMIEGLPDTFSRILSSLKKGNKVSKAAEEAFDNMQV